MTSLLENEELEPLAFSRGGAPVTDAFPPNRSIQPSPAPVVVPAAPVEADPKEPVVQSVDLMSVWAWAALVRSIPDKNIPDKNIPDKSVRSEDSRFNSKFLQNYKRNRDFNGISSRSRPIVPMDFHQAGLPG